MTICSKTSGKRLNLETALLRWTSCLKIVKSTLIIDEWLLNIDYLRIKSQIPSTKLQMVRQAHHPEQRRRVNFKFQYPMIKTFTAVEPYRCTNLCCQLEMPFGTNADGVCVLNFEFGSLGFVWNLVFGAWNFHDFPYQAIFESPIACLNNIALLHPDWNYVPI